MKDLSHRKTFSKAWRLGAISFATSMALAERVYAQKDPWDTAGQVLQTAFTGLIATGLALWGQSSAVVSASECYPGACVTLASLARISLNKPSRSWAGDLNASASTVSGAPTTR
jgi:hypothetical protein